MIHKTLFSFILCVCFFISCNEKTPTGSSNSDQQVSTMTTREREELKPADPSLAEKYNRSCFICHTNPDAKAPLVGDKIAWRKLIDEKGLDQLVINVRNGVNTMPPTGQCPDCTDEDYKQLIEFMAGESK